MFTLKWLPEALDSYDDLKAKASRSSAATKGRNSSKAVGLFKQVLKALTLLQSNPRHPGLHTHEFASISNPFDPKQKVYEAYVQNNTPGAYRIFWCYGPSVREITLIAITPHP